MRGPHRHSVAAGRHIRPLERHQPLPRRPDEDAREAADAEEGRLRGEGGGLQGLEGKRVALAGKRRVPLHHRRGVEVPSARFREASRHLYSTSRPNDNAQCDANHNSIRGDG